MNELIEWFPQLNALDLKVLVPQVTTMMKSASFLQSLNAHGLSLQSLKSESSIFFIYVMLGVITKRSVYPLAFFMCFLLVNASVFRHSHCHLVPDCVSHPAGAMAVDHSCKTGHPCRGAQLCLRALL